MVCSLQNCHWLLIWCPLYDGSRDWVEYHEELVSVQYRFWIIHRNPWGHWNSICPWYVPKQDVFEILTFQVVEEWISAFASEPKVAEWDGMWRRNLPSRCSVWPNLTKTHYPQSQSHFGSVHITIKKTWTQHEMKRLNQESTSYSISTIATMHRDLPQRVWSRQPRVSTQNSRWKRSRLKKNFYITCHGKTKAQWLRRSLTIISRTKGPHSN